MPRVKYTGLEPLSLHPQHGEIKRVEKGADDKQGGGRDVYPGEVIEVPHLFGKTYLVQVEPPKAGK